MQNSQSHDQPPRLSWGARRALWFVFCFAVLGVPMIVLAILGTPWLSALLHGVLIGYVVLIGTFGLAEMLVPAAFLRWRAWMMEGGPREFAQLGTFFDKLLLDGSRGYLRLRLLGAALLIFGLIVAAAMWWLFGAVGLT